MSAISTPGGYRRKDAPYKDFCQKGGRFGPHNTNQEIHLPDVEKPGNLVYLTYFNAGLRVYDIKDPHLPVETGYFIPPQSEKHRGPQPHTKLVQQTEDVRSTRAATSTSTTSSGACGLYATLGWTSRSRRRGRGWLPMRVAFCFATQDHRARSSIRLH